MDNSLFLYIPTVQEQNAAFLYPIYKKCGYMILFAQRKRVKQLDVFLSFVHVLMYKFI